MLLALDLQNLSKVELGVGALSAQGNNPLLPNDQRNLSLSHSENLSSSLFAQWGVQKQINVFVVL